MRQRLFSRSRIYYKRILPAVWISCFAMVTVALWCGVFEGSEEDLTWMKFVFLAVTLVGASFLLWFARRLKLVWLEDRHIRISDLSTEEIVPLADVVEATESRFVGPKTITLRLRHPGRWGDRICFVAPLRLQLPFSDHPVVRELRARAALEVRHSAANTPLG